MTKQILPGNVRTPRIGRDRCTLDINDQRPVVEADAGRGDRRTAVLERREQVTQEPEVARPEHPVTHEVPAPLLRQLDRAGLGELDAPRRHPDLPSDVCELRAVLVLLTQLV